MAKELASVDLTIIAGPLIGAVIGYFTNYLAVKMLFRREKRNQDRQQNTALHTGSHPERKAAAGTGDRADGRRHPGHRRGYQKELAVELYAGGCGR